MGRGSRDIAAVSTVTSQGVGKGTIRRPGFGIRSGWQRPATPGPCRSALALQPTARHFTASFLQYQHRGRIQVGVGEARSRGKKPSVSVHVTGPRGPADPADPRMGLHFVHNVTNLCFDILLRIPSRRKTIHFATQLSAIAVLFLNPPEILSSYHFFHLNSS